MQASPSRSGYVYSRSRVDQETDPYSPVIVEDLLNGLNEWRNIQDIVRLTFKALSDVVKAQGTAIKEMERQMGSKASKTEVNAGLAVKANVSDVSRSVAEVVTSLERKINLEDVQVLVEEKVSRSDLQYLLSTKVSMDELRSAVDSKVNIREYESEVHTLVLRVDEIQHEIAQRLSSQAALSQRDLQHVIELLETKADDAEVKEALENKANKQSVANALHRKANKAEIDEVLEHKADVGEVKSLLSLIDSKSDRSALDRLAQSLETRVERTELSRILTSEFSQRPGRSEYESVVVSLSSYKTDTEKRLAGQMAETEAYLKQLRMDLDRGLNSLLSSLGKKADSKEFDRLISLLSKKADSDQIVSIVSSLKQDLNSASAAHQSALSQDSNRLEAKLMDFAGKFDKEISHLDGDFRVLEQELGRVREDVRNAADHQKADMDETLRFVQSANANTRADVLSDLKTFKTGLEQVNTQLDDLNRRKADRKELHEFRLSVSSLLDTKTSKTDVEGALAAADEAIDKQLRLVQDDFRLVLTRLEKDFSAQIEKRAIVSEVQNLLNEKVDNLSLSRIISSRATIEDFSSVKTAIEQLSGEIRRKAEQSELMGHVKVTQQSFEEVRKDVIPRAAFQDLYVSVGAKANAEDLRQEIESLHHALNLKVSGEELRVHIDEQQVINEAVCAETCVARWLWKSGDLRSGFSVPWEVQSINTCPENFIWDRDSPVVSTITPGLYEVLVGFFARKRPGIQLLVNGEPLIVSNGNGCGIYRNREVLRHSQGNLAGVTMVEFVALPEKCRLSVTYTGDPGEGFFCLRKL